MYVLVNMETDGKEYSMKVVGTYETWLDAQGAMCDDVKGYVKDCEWEDGRWEVCNRQAYAYPPSDALNRDDLPVSDRACSFWAIFDTEKLVHRWCSWMLGTNYWARQAER